MSVGRFQGLPEECLDLGWPLCPSAPNLLTHSSSAPFTTLPKRLDLRTISACRVRQPSTRSNLDTCTRVAK